MSHISQCKTNIQDLDTLQAACEELGFTVLRNSTCKLYYSRQNFKSDLVIRGKGMKYDIGVKQNEDGTYELVTDFFMGSVKKAAGKCDNNLGDILEMYGVHGLEKLARKKRLKTKRVRKADRTTVRVYS